MSKNIANSILRLPNGWYSISTIRGGIVIIDKKGRLVQILDKEKGIIDNTIRHQYLDRQNGLWLATSRGISRVEVLSPYTIFDERVGINGWVKSIQWHQGTLYIANELGVFYLGKDTQNISRIEFKQIRGTYEATALLSTEKSLFAAALSGVYEIVNGRIVNTFSPESNLSILHAFVAHSILRSKIDPNRIYIGAEDYGLFLLKRVDGTWTNAGRIFGVDAVPKKIVEDGKGNLWLATFKKGVWRVGLASAKIDSAFHHPPVRHFKIGKELPEGDLSLHLVNGQPVFKIGEELYKYNNELDSIVVDHNLDKWFGRNERYVIPDRITQNVGTAIYRDGCFHETDCVRLRFAGRKQKN